MTLTLPVTLVTSQVTIWYPGCHFL